MATENADEQLTEKIHAAFMDHYLPEAEGPFGADEEILKFLGVPMRDDRRFYPEQQKQVVIFFREFTKFIKEKHRNPKDRDELYEYLSRWDEVAFSVSPNIFNFLPIDNQLEFAAALSRLPEAQGTICQATGGELVYEMQWMGGGENCS